MPPMPLDRDEKPVLCRPGLSMLSRDLSMLPRGVCSPSLLAAEGLPLRGLKPFKALAREGMLGTALVLWFEIGVYARSATDRGNAGR